MRLYNKIEAPFEKTAMMVKLSENTDNWTNEITNEAYNQLPFLAGKEISVDIQKMNDENKSALGVIKVASGKKFIVLPVIIKQAQMCPLDVMFIDGMIIPATKQDADRYMFDPSLFKGMAPANLAGMDKQLDSAIFPFSLQGKFASTINKEDYDRVMDEVKQDAFLNKYLADRFKSITPKEIEKTAEKTVEAPSNLDAVVMYREGKQVAAVGVTIDPFGIFYYNNPELEKTASEVLEDKNEVFIGTGEGLKKMSERKPTTGVIDIPGKGKGIYFDTVVDLDGKVLDNKILILSEAYSVQEKIAGISLDPEISVSNNPMGKGVFYYPKDDSYVAVFPMTVKGKSSDRLVANDAFGRTIKLAFSEDIVTPVKIASNEYVLPGGSKFIKLPNSLRDIPSFTNKELLEKDRFTVTTDDLGNYKISGPAVNGISIEGYPEKIAAAVILGLGATSTEAMNLIKEASQVGSAVGYTEKRLRTLVDNSSEKEELLNRLVGEVRVNLLKEAATMVKFLSEKNTSLRSFAKVAEIEQPEELVDNLLSLNFINKDNLITFVEQLPELKKTASTLASLLIASRLGVTAIPEKAITSSISNLTKVISGLSLIKDGY